MNQSKVADLLTFTSLGPGPLMDFFVLGLFSPSGGLMVCFGPCKVFQQSFQCRRQSDCCSYSRHGRAVPSGFGAPDPNLVCLLLRTPAARWDRWKLGATFNIFQHAWLPTSSLGFTELTCGSASAINNPSLTTTSPSPYSLFATPPCPKHVPPASWPPRPPWHGVNWGTEATKATTENCLVVQVAVKLPKKDRGLGLSRDISDDFLNRQSHQSPICFCPLTDRSHQICFVKLRSNCLSTRKVRQAPEAGEEVCLLWNLRS